MRVLVVGSVPISVRGATDDLERAGHEVVRCHDDTGPAFPCAALKDGHGCPFDGEPVDVVLDLHEATTRAPSAYEDGATCGIRRHVPLVVAADGQNAFDAWSTMHVSRADDLVRACELAAGAPLAEHSELATETARASLTSAGVEPEDVSAVVHRVRGSLHVVLALPDGCNQGLRSMVASRVVTALRAHDSTALGIDVSLA